MKRTLMLALPLLMAVSAVAGELEIGADLPLADVKMADVSGKKVSLNDAMGENGLLVVFSCNTCPWVDAWEDRYVKVSKKYQKKGVGMIAFNPSTTLWTKNQSLLLPSAPHGHLTSTSSIRRGRWSTAVPSMIMPADQGKWRVPISWTPLTL